MSVDEFGEAADRNLAAAWASFGRHAGFAVETVGDLTLTSTGLPAAYFNSGFLCGRVADPVATVEVAMAFFAQRSVPYLLWVRAGVDDDFVGACRAAGLSDAGGPPAMVLAPIATTRPQLPDVDLVVASSTDDVEIHRQVVSASFGLPIEAARRLMADSILDDPACAIVIGRVDGVPVTTALMSKSGETAGIYNVGTIDTHRGQGLGTAATAAAVMEGADRGCTHSVLQSSESGYAVYQAMGYTDIGRYQHLEGPPV